MTDIDKTKIDGRKNNGGHKPKGEPTKPVTFRLPMDIIEWLSTKPNQTRAVIEALREVMAK